MSGIVFLWGFINSSYVDSGIKLTSQRNWISVLDNMELLDLKNCCVH